MNEMPADVLHSLGFRMGGAEYGNNHWYHPKHPNKILYYHILNPEQVALALIEIGREQMRQEIIAKMGEIG